MEGIALPGGTPAAASAAVREQQEDAHGEARPGEQRAVRLDGPEENLKEDSRQRQKHCLLDAVREV
jgi:hypothetical protein